MGVVGGGGSSQVRLGQSPSAIVGRSLSAGLRFKANNPDNERMAPR